MISYSDRIKAMSWSQVREQVFQLKPDFAKVIDELDPPEYFRIYKVQYHYGDDVLKEGVLHVPFAGQMLPLHDGRIDPVLQCDLQYAQGIPMGFVLNKLLEVYFNHEYQRVPFYVMEPGRIMGLWSVLDHQGVPDEQRLWNVTAGARSCFMLPKIGDALAHKKLVQTFGINAGVPKKLSDHWSVFRELSLHQKDERWTGEVLFFSKQWFEEDANWPTFSKYLYQYVWETSRFFRHQWIYDFIYSCVQGQKGFKPNPYVVDTVKHLVALGQGQVPGFRPCDSNDALPYDFLQKVYVDVYQLKPYAPVLMCLDYLKKDTPFPLYYSLHLPTLMEFSPKSKKMSSYLFDLREIKYVLGVLMEEFFKQEQRYGQSQSSLYHLAKSIDFKCFHADDDIFDEVSKSQDIPFSDARMSQQLGRYPDMEFCDNSPFYKGCVQVGVKS